MSFKQFKWIISLCLFTALLSLPLAAALTPGNSYLVTLDKIDAEGDPILVSSQTVTANNNGVIAYSFDNVPSCDQDGVHFLLITVGNAPEDRDTDGRLIGVSDRLAQVLVPAPPRNGQAFTGASELTALQTKAILRTFDISQTGDPFLATLGNVVFKSPSLDANIVTYMGLMLQIEVMDPYSGFYSYLSNTAGLSDSQLDLFRSALVCSSAFRSSNSLSSRFTTYSHDLTLDYSLADISKDLYEAEIEIGATDNSSFQEAIARIGNRVAKVILNAATVSDSSGTEAIGSHHLLNAMHKIKFNSLSGDYLSESADVRRQSSRILEFTWRTMIQRLYPETSKREWLAAMTLLNASDEQIESFATAITTMDTAFDDLAAAQSDTYRSYDGSVAVADQFGTMFNSGKNIINDFTKNIQASEADIRTFITLLANYMDYQNITMDGFTPQADPYDDAGFFGPYKENMFSNYTGFSDEGLLRMSIPQLVIYNFIYSKLQPNPGSHFQFRSNYNYNQEFQQLFSDGWTIQMVNWFVLCHQAQRAYLYYQHDYWDDSNKIISGRGIYKTLLDNIASDIDIVDSNGNSLITTDEKNAIVTLFKEAEKIVYSQTESDEIYSFSNTPSPSDRTLFNETDGNRRYYSTLLKDPNTVNFYKCYADGITSQL